MHRHARDALVEHQLVDGGAGGCFEVLPVPRADRGVGERVPALHDEPGYLADAARIQRLGGRAQRQHGISHHCVAHRRIPASGDHQVAAEHAVGDRRRRQKGRREPVAGAELHQRSGAGEELLVRRGHEQLARVVRVDRVARHRLDDEEAKMRVAEHRVGDQRVDAGAQDGARQGGRGPARGAGRLVARCGGRERRSDDVWITRNPARGRCRTAGAHAGENGRRWRASLRWGQGPNISGRRSAMCSVGHGVSLFAVPPFMA